MARGCAKPKERRAPPSTGVGAPPSARVALISAVAQLGTRTVAS